MKKLTVSLYPEASYWLRKSNLAWAVLDKLNIRSMSEEASRTRAMNLTDEEYYKLRSEAMRRGESVTMMINEQIIQLGRERMGQKAGRKTNEIFVVYLDRLLKMYPEITDFNSMMNVCWEHYYVPKDIDEMYLITDRVDDVALNIVNEAVRRNRNQKHTYYYGVTEDQFAQIRKNGVRTYVERPTDTITEEMRRVYTHDYSSDPTHADYAGTHRPNQAVEE